MNVIKILPEQEARKIAAGEVVERPASVVKELLENSLDAGATQISLYIEKAGSQLIRIVDNGCGMTVDDAKLCFIDHATSKISSLDDLESIDSFGFRGEALASISAVSKVILVTRRHDSTEQIGVQVACTEGVVSGEQSVACSVGTDISVHDLFFNTPVRKKFLKQDETEWNQVLTLFQAVCLSNIHVHAKLYRDEKLVLNAPVAKDIVTRAHQLWGAQTAENLVELGGQEQGAIKVSGVTSQPTFWRYGRQQMFFFVNNRWIKNGELGKAVMKGYQNVLPPGRFPASVLFISVDKSQVDVNVHPRKEDVRFVKPGVVETLVQRAVMQALEGYVNKQLQRPIISATQQPSFQQIPKFFDQPTVVRPQFEIHAGTGEVQSVSQAPVPRAVESFPDPWQGVLKVSPLQNPVVVQQKIGSAITKSEQAEVEEFSGKIIGQLLQTYILVDREDGLLIIDQHAAHERILYEKILHRFEQKDGTRLLFPEIIKFGAGQLAVVIGEQDFLKQQGIDVEQIGPDEIAITSAPPKIQNQSLRELIFEMIEFFSDHEHLEKTEFRKKLNEHMHSQMACKMAVKAGDPLSPQMMENILRDLCQVPNRYICVHGRPTMWTIRKDELEKNFRRR